MPTVGESWGRYVRASQHIIRVSDRDAPLPTVTSPALPYGNGRSYGDSCLNDGGVLLHCRGLDRLMAFDPSTGVLQCESGVLFSDILDITVPQGWFLPVTPGTRFVTVGGAIANDVHGKNHHRAGTFGHHVLSLELLRTDGSRTACSPHENWNLFAATIGGLGLTGFISHVTLQLKRIASSWMTGESIKFGSLDEFFTLSKESERDYEYTVAWIDCTRRGAALGRGLFSRANHSPARRQGEAKRQGGLSIPVVSPISLVNPISVRAFNTLYYHRQRRRVVRSVSHYEPFFYPLDGVRDWNRIYGPRGFLQYQCVVPEHAPAKQIAALLEEVSQSGEGSFLAVLKQFGNMPSLGLLSFPRRGTTLALDFPNTGDATLRLLNRLDDIVDDVGGAVYPAKDARMSGARFRRYFPRHECFETFRDPGMSSSFWRRVME